MHVEIGKIIILTHKILSHQNHEIKHQQGKSNYVDILTVGDH